jgi:hypothetical protein
MTKAGESVSIAFLDPRTNPDPRAPRPPARFTTDVDELTELSRLCRDGRLYDVERWIAGRCSVSVTGSSRT